MNRNRILKTSKEPLKSQARQGTSLFTSAATNHRDFSKGWSRETQVRIPEGQEGTEQLLMGGVSTTMQEESRKGKKEIIKKEDGEVIVDSYSVFQLSVYT